MDMANITVIGNALNTPEWRRFERTNALVAHFKIASTARRYDKVNGRWVDGDNLRVRVNCWRRLAEGVVASVKVGDPVIVTGRMFTRDWTGDDGQRRSTYELEATSIGHDLSRGVAAFKRGRINVNTTVIEDAETDKHVQGEPTSAAPEANARSEALAASVGEELRIPDGGPDGPPVGYDSPINAEGVSMENLQAMISGGMRGDLNTLITTAQRTLGGTTTTLDPADPLPSDGEGDGSGEGGGNEAASAVEAPASGEPSASGETSDAASDSGDGPVEPIRVRRGRTRVGANA